MELFEFLFIEVVEEGLMLFRFKVSGMNGGRMEREESLCQFIPLKKECSLICKIDNRYSGSSTRISLMRSRALLFRFFGRFN